MTCIAIDDDDLFLRKLEAYISELPWLTLLETHSNPVQGATAVISQKPDILFLDLDMPQVDGNYFMDWVEPSWAVTDERPKVVIITSKQINEVDKMLNVSGIISKSEMASPIDFEEKLKAILNDFTPS